MLADHPQNAYEVFHGICVFPELPWWGIQHPAGSIHTGQPAQWLEIDYVDDDPGCAANGTMKVRRYPHRVERIVGSRQLVPECLQYLRLLALARGHCEPGHESDSQSDCEGEHRHCGR